MTPEEFRRAGHELIDWIADYRRDLAAGPVGARVEPGEVRARLGPGPPTGGEELAALLADLDEVVVPGITQVQHPRHLGWFPANATLSSVLGDIACAGLGSLGITWQSAPALTEVEEACVDWMRQLCGLSARWRGTIHDTASSACLVAMLCARERASEVGQDGGGLQAEPRPLVVYATTHAHSAIPKAVLLAGFGRDNLRLVPADPVTGELSVEGLAAAMAADAAAGRRPAAVVASVGTTGITAFDPIGGIVEVAAAHDAWVHVDAAMAGALLLLPEERHRFEGLEGADSFSWNPHKWMGTILDCSLFYVRDVSRLVAVMSTNPSFLRSDVDGEVTQYKDWGIPLGRRFRALKLWFQLRLDGIAPVQARLRRDLANAAWLAGRVGAAPDWTVVAPVTMQTVCVRHEPPGASPDAVDEHTVAWAAALNRSGEAFVTPAQHEGRWMVRLSIGVEHTERADVAAVWDSVRRHAEALAPAR
jgi:aromatic-L-amino-acid/L-tryptophan decarboxylase